MRQEKLPGIQFARAVAALSVCYFHSWTVLDRFTKETAHPLPWLSQHGWLGVDLFFAISGFVIAMQTQRAFDARQFLIKRAFRLYPLWWLCLTTFGVLAFAWRGLQSHETAWNFLYSATLLPTEGFPFYDIGWSLQHEMMFYLAAALIVPALGVIGLITFLLIGVALADYLPAALQVLAFYYPEFLAGIIAFHLLPYFRRMGPILLLVAGVVGLYVFLEHWGGRRFFPIPLFFLVSGFALMPRAPLIAVGNASYSLYLLHPIVFALMKGATIPALGTLWLQEPIRWASIAATIFLSLVCFRYFERPINEAGHRMSKWRSSAPAEIPKS